MHCEIHNVRINCKLNTKKECILKRGSNYTLDMDFTPDFDAADQLTVTASAWVVASYADFPGQDTNACNWMTCPVVKNTRQTYTFKLSMDKNYPKGTFKTRWWMRQGEDSKCCFMNRFKIE